MTCITCGLPHHGCCTCLSDATEAELDVCIEALQRISLDGWQNDEKARMKLAREALAKVGGCK